MHDGLKIGVVDALRSRAEAIAARNPHLARKLLGADRAAKLALQAAPGIEPPKKRPTVAQDRFNPPRKTGRPIRWPWKTIEVGHHFTIPVTSNAKAVQNQVRLAGFRFDRKFSMKREYVGGSLVYRVTRVA